MDGNTSMDGSTKKMSLEELSKEELVKKCRSLITLAQKAKHTKDVLVEENTKLMEQMNNSVTDEVIENLTQQKLSLVTALEERKGQHKALEKKLTDCQDQLNISEMKLGDLDTENQSFKRQVFRLTEENEQLITHLDGLEKQIEELKRIGLEQQQQLLVLEKNNTVSGDAGGSQIGDDDGAMVELQKMLTVSLEEVQKLKTKNSELTTKIETCTSDLLEKNNEILKLTDAIETFKTQPQNASLVKDNELLKTTLNESAESIQMYQQEIEDKNKEIEKHTSTADDLNTEIHKNRALIQKLKQDIASMSHRLNDNQIVSSGLTTDLQNTNEKMKDKLKFYHSKIVKFAGDVKKLKEDKQFVLDDFKTYNEQVLAWREQLVLAVHNLTQETNASNAAKKCLIETIESQKAQINTLLMEKKTINDELNEKIEILSKQIQDMNTDAEKQRCNESEKERLELLDEISTQKEQLVMLIREKEETNDYLTERWLVESNKVQEIEKEKQSCYDEINGLVEEIASQKQQIAQLIQEKQSTNDELTEKIGILTKQIQDMKNNGEKQRCNESEKERLELLDEISTQKEQIVMLIKEKEETNDYLTERWLVESTKVQEIEKEKQACFDEKNGLVEEIASQKEQISMLIENETTSNEQLVILNNKIQDLVKQLTSHDEEIRLIKDANEKELTLEQSNSKKMCLELQAILDATREKCLQETNIYRDEIKTLKNQLNETVKLHEALLQENKGLNIQIEQLSTKLKDNSIELSSRIENSVPDQILLSENVELKSQLSAQADELKNVITEKEAFQFQLTSTKTIVDDNNRLIQELRKAIEHLENEVEISKANEVKLVEKYGHEESKLTRENQSLQDKNEELLGKLATLEDKLENSQRTSDIEALRRENAELLAEMNEMNQALKERGETINRQQTYCDEVLMKMNLFESQATQKDETILQNNKLIKSVQDDNKIISDELAQLREDNLLLKDKLNNLETSTDSCYAESETLSTSTISRSEEANRLKDLDGSWEERYGKLRTLALKLKTKIREQTVEINKEQVDKADAQQKLASSTKTVQTIQTQCDKLQDELEKCKTDNKTILKQLDTLKSDGAKDKKQIAFNEESITKLKTEIDGLNKDKSNIDNFKKQVGVKFQSLKKELEANTVLRKDFESRIQKLNADLDLKEKSLKEEKEKHAQTKTSLLESNNECKKQSVLNLEMQDYERSIKDLSQKLEKKNELITKLKNQVDSQKSTVNALKEQNRLLEERTGSFESELSAYRIEVNTFKKNVSDLEVVVNDKDLEIQEYLKALENTRSENEDLSTQLSKIIAEHQKTNNILRGEKDHLRGENLGLEQRLLEVEERLKMRELELEGVQNDYRGYKVRAQSVLRQNQSRDVGLEEKLVEEAASLRAKVEVLNGEVVEMKATIEKLSGANGSLQLEKSEVDKAKLELVIEIEDCREEYKKLQLKHQQAIAEHAESMRGLKVHADTLSQCYRQQISEQEVRHNREIIELQSKLEKGSTTTDIPPLAIPSMPREEGEGSESVDSTNGNVHPLERLLGTDQDHEISIIKKQLNDNESKVVHLTALLADTEQDLAKHVQMNKLLKEEIRRQQRSVEREKHAENLEYMKNVVFKFITLSSGDERHRLVPVLNTILKLSPEETQKLNLVAKGDKSWSTYLPIWSSPGKPQ